MRRIDLSSFAQYFPDPPAPEPDPDPNAAIVDGTLAQAFNNDFTARQQALLNDGPDAFYAKQGADALSATPGVLDQLQTLRDQLVGSTVDPRQRQIARHALSQQRVWQKTTAQDRLDLLGKQAGPAAWIAGFWLEWRRRSFRFRHALRSQRRHLHPVHHPELGRCSPDRPHIQRVFRRSVLFRKLFWTRTRMSRSDAPDFRRDSVRIAPTFTTFLEAVAKSWPDMI
jgi:hypothetical protein